MELTVSLRTLCAVAYFVLVESGHDSIGIGSQRTVQSAFGAIKPIALEDFVFFGNTLAGAHVEVAVTKSAEVETGFHIIIVHAESSQDDVAIVPTQVTIEGHHSLCLERQEDGIDELDDIETAKVAKLVQQTQEIDRTPPRA